MCHIQSCIQATLWLDTCILRMTKETSVIHAFNNIIIIPELWLTYVQQALFPIAEKFPEHPHVLSPLFQCLDWIASHHSQWYPHKRHQESYASWHENSDLQFHLEESKLAEELHIYQDFFLFTDSYNIATRYHANMLLYICNALGDIKATTTGLVCYHGTCGH